MSQTHKCKYMGNEQYPGENPPNYLYKWDGENGGWRLYTNDKPFEGSGHSWACSCNWCSEPLPVIDIVPKLDPLKAHRCEAMIRGEWAHNQGCETPAEYHCYAVIWDGHTWNTMNGDEVIGRRTPVCNYCLVKLHDPKGFRNKVIIQ